MMGTDMPSMWAAIHKKTGIYPRVLADRFFFKLPIVNQGMTWIFQGLLASRPVADIAFKRNYNLLVYPGGFQEAFRKKSTEKYSLNWGKRDGFARYAMRHGYTIVPVSAVGIEDSFKILHDMPTDAFFRLIQDVRPPLTAPFFVPTGYERQYFKLHDPIDTEGMEFTDENVAKVRELTKELIESGITDLKEVRKKDPNRYVIPSLIRSLRNRLSL